MSTDYSDIESWMTKYPQCLRFFPNEVGLLDELKSNYPDIPVAYVDFLTQFGGVDIDQAFMLYNSVFLPEEIFGKDSEEFAGILLIGDDYAGQSVGFDARNSWNLVSIDSATREIGSGYIFVDDEIRDTTSFYEWINYLIPDILSENETS